MPSRKDGNIPNLHFRCEASRPVLCAMLDAGLPPPFHGDTNCSADGFGTIQKTSDQIFSTDEDALLKRASRKITPLDAAILKMSSREAPCWQSE